MALPGTWRAWVASRATRPSEATPATSGTSPSRSGARRYRPRGQAPGGGGSATDRVTCTPTSAVRLRIQIGWTKRNRIVRLPRNEHAAAGGVRGRGDGSCLRVRRRGQLHPGLPDRGGHRRDREREQQRGERQQQRRHRLVLGRRRERRRRRADLHAQRRLHGPEPLPGQQRLRVPRRPLHPDRQADELRRRRPLHDRHLRYDDQHLHAHAGRRQLPHRRGLQPQR